MRKLAPGWFLDSPIPDLSGVIAQLVLHQSRNFLRSSAETAANGFVIPAELLTNEAELLASTGSFESYLNRKKSAVLELEVHFFYQSTPRSFQQRSLPPIFLKRSRVLYFTGDRYTWRIQRCSSKLHSNWSPGGFRISHDSLQHTFSTHAYKFWQKSQDTLLPLMLL